MPGHGLGWWHALRTPVGAVWLLLFPPILTLAPQWSGQFDLVVAGHVMAGERFLYVPGFAVWSFCVWWRGRRTDSERDFCQSALVSCAIALLTAWISFERWSDGWVLYQASIGLAQIFIALQLRAWAAVARVERPGVIILACCATVEFLIFAVVQYTGWDRSCVIGLGLTCLKGPFVTLMSTMVGIIAMYLWTIWLGRRAGGN